MKTIEAKIKIPLYFADLIIIQSDNIQKILKKYNVRFDAHGFGAVTFRDPLKSGYNRYVIAFSNDDISPSLIAHEALHVVTYLFDDKLIRIDNSNDEPAAYLLGWIVAEIHKRIKLNNGSS